LVQVVHHTGDVPGVTVALGLLPDLGVGVAMLCNGDNQSKAHEEVFRAVVDAVLGVSPDTDDVYPISPSFVLCLSVSAFSHSLWTGSRLRQAQSPRPTRICYLPMPWPEHTPPPPTARSPSARQTAPPRTAHPSWLHSEPWATSMRRRCTPPGRACGARTRGSGRRASYAQPRCFRRATGARGAHSSCR
jgi:hypothetical protein